MTDDEIKQRAAEIMREEVAKPNWSSRAIIERALREGMAMVVVPDRLLMLDGDDRDTRMHNAGWNNCRAAMLARNGE